MLDMTKKRPRRGRLPSGAWGLAFGGALALALALAPGIAHADLRVYVGYAGGPYYEKAYYTDSQLWAMADAATYEYSSIDAGGYLRKGFAQGVRLSNLLESSDINPWGMWRFYLSTSDNYVIDDGGYGTNGDAWYYSQLEGVARYYYPTYLQNAAFEYGRVQVFQEGLTALRQQGVRVPTLLALSSSFNRVESIDSPAWTDPSKMNSASGIRLMYGQTDPLSGNARDSAHSIRSITCILGGSSGTDLPEIDFGVDSIAGEVGSEITLYPGLSNVMDQLVADMGVFDIEWTSSDESVFTVRKNADGSITIIIVGEGNATLGASFGNSPYGEFVSTGSVGTSGQAGSGAGEEGEGNGSEGDEGDGNRNSGGTADSVTLGAGTSLWSASLKSTAAEGAGSGEDSLEGGGDNGGDGEGETISTETVSETALAITAKPQTYELSFEDLPEMPQEEQGAPWWLALAAGSCAAFGGTRRVVRFERAKDRR